LGISGISVNIKRPRLYQDIRQMKGALDTHKSVEWRMSTLIVFNHWHGIPFVHVCRVSNACFAPLLAKQKQRKMRGVGASRGADRHPKWSEKSGSEGSRERHRERKALPRRLVVVAKATTYAAKPAADPRGHRFVVCRHMSKVARSGVAHECQGCQNGNVVVIFAVSRLAFVVPGACRWQLPLHLLLRVPDPSVSRVGLLVANRARHPGCFAVRCHPERAKRRGISLSFLSYTLAMSRTTIDLDERLIRQARKLTGLKTKREIVERALQLLVRFETRKGILRFYGSGIWKGDLKASRRNRI
jgi:hypothetical protein